MKWLLIRHGQTQGNREHRYIGCRTDEPLCPEGIAALQGKSYPPAAKVYVSPLRRCLETAALLYPDVPTEVVEDFRECDFRFIVQSVEHNCELCTNKRIVRSEVIRVTISAHQTSSV